MNIDEDLIQLILTDLNMPIMNGFELALNVKNYLEENNFKNITIISYSSQDVN